jgi:hypothetical protein
MLPRIRLRMRRAAARGISKGAIMDRWLEYDIVALAMLVFGLAAVQLLALTF